MNKVLETPRPKLSPFAPQFDSIMISPDIIRVVIGPGGKNIKAITAETGADVDIEDSGKDQYLRPHRGSHGAGKRKDSVLRSETRSG